MVTRQADVCRVPGETPGTTPETGMLPKRFLSWQLSLGWDSLKPSMLAFNAQSGLNFDEFRCEQGCRGG